MAREKKVNLERVVGDIERVYVAIMRDISEKNKEVPLNVTNMLGDSRLVNDKNNKLLRVTNIAVRVTSFRTHFMTVENQIHKFIAFDYELVDTMRVRTISQGVAFTNMLDDNTSEFSYNNVASLVQSHGVNGAKKELVKKSDQFIKKFFTMLYEGTCLQMATSIIKYLEILSEEIKTNKNEERVTKENKCQSQDLKALQTILDLAGKGMVKGNLKCKFELSGDFELSFDSSFGGKLKSNIDL